MGFATGTFAKDSSGVYGRTQNLNLDFTPVGLKLWMDGSTVFDSSSAGYCLSIGLISDGVHYSVASAAEDNVSGSSNANHRMDAKGLVIIDPDGTLLAECTIELASRKAVLTWTTNNSIANRIHYCAWGVDCEAKVVQWDMEAGNVTISGLEFAPNCLFSIMVGETVAFPQVGTDVSYPLLAVLGVSGRLSYGWRANVSGADIGCYTAIYSKDAMSGPRTRKVLETTSTGSSSAHVGEFQRGGDGSEAAVPLYGATFTSDGFIATRIQGSIPYKVATLCLKVPEVRAGMWLKKTSAGSDPVTFDGSGAMSVAPDGVILCTRASASNDTAHSDLQICIGAISASSEHCSHVVDDDGANPTDANKQSSNTKCIRMTSVAGVMHSEADFESLSTTGFAVNWSTSNGSALAVAYIAFSAPEAEPFVCGSISYGSYDFPNTFHVFDEGIKWTLPSINLPRQAGARVLAGHRHPRGIGVRGGIIKGPLDTSDFRARYDEMAEALEAGPATLVVREDRHYRNVEVESAANITGMTGFDRIADGVTIRFIAPDGFEYSDEVYSDDWASPTSGGTRTVTTTGDAYTLPQFLVTVSGTGTLSFTLENTTTGEVFILSGAVTSGQIITVDCDQEIVTIGGVDEMDLFDGSWPRLDPGANVLEVTFSGVSVSNIQTRWNDRW